MQSYSYNEIKKMDRLFRTHFVNSLAGFKSLNLVGTLGQSGISNLCIVNSAIHIGANPPLMAFISRPPSVERHTLENILSTGFFTLNHIHKSILKQAHQCSAKYKREESEFDKTGLTPYFSKRKDFIAPYVDESNIKIGLEYKKHLNIDLNDTIMVIGQITEIILNPNIVGNDGFVDINAAGTLTNSGLDAYYETTKVNRLSYARPDESVREIR